MSHRVKNSSSNPSDQAIFTRASDSAQKGEVDSGLVNEASSAHGAVKDIAPQVAGSIAHRLLSHLTTSNGLAGTKLFSSGLTSSIPPDEGLTQLSVSENHPHHKGFLNLLEELCVCKDQGLERIFSGINGRDLIRDDDSDIGLS